MTGLVIAAVGAGGLGACAGPVLTARGLRELRLPTSDTIGCRSWPSSSARPAARSPPWPRAMLGLCGGSLPLMVWAVVLTAAAIADGYTRRIPTRLIRIGGLVTAVLVAGAGVVTHDWRALILTATATLAAGAILALCWRFAGAGFGDVRLATVGGLGLGHTTHHALSIAVAGFAVVSRSASDVDVRAHPRSQSSPGPWPGARLRLPPRGRGLTCPGRMNRLAARITQDDCGPRAGRRRARYQKFRHGGRARCAMPSPRTVHGWHSRGAPVPGGRLGSGGGATSR